MNASRLLLARHGESEANRDDRFAGWENVPLTRNGADQARSLGKRLRDDGVNVDRIYTSLLQRASASASLVAGEIGLDAAEVIVDWRLNERHYGALTGRSKEDVRAVYGQEQTAAWRRNFNERPPEIGSDAQQRLIAALREQGALPDKVPSTESLADTQTRVAELLSDTIVPLLRSGRSALLMAHGNSIRVLIALLEERESQDLSDIEVRNGELITYAFDDAYRPHLLVAP